MATLVRDGVILACLIATAVGTITLRKGASDTRAWLALWATMLFLLFLISEAMVRSR